MGSRSSKTATPWRRDRWPIDTWRTSALISMSEVLSRSTSTEWTLGQAEAACDPGKRRRLDDREDDDEHEDEVEDPLGVGVPVVRGTVASTTGTARAGPPTRGRPGRATTPGTTRWRGPPTGPRDEQQDEADDDGRDDLLTEPGRVGEQAEQDEEADLGEPASAVAQLWNDVRLGRPMLPRTSAHR